MNYQADQEPVLIDSLGMWTLNDLGFGELAFEPGGEIDNPLVQYTLPDGASQGPNTWYLAHLNVHIRFSERTGRGNAYVTASVNGAVSVQLKFEVARDGGGAPVITWSSVDLIDGRIEGAITGVAGDVRSRNFIQTAGVRPGLNNMSFALELDDGVEVTLLQVLADSGVEYTSRGPPRLTIDLDVPDMRVDVGDQFSIGYRVEDIGGYKAKAITIGASYPKEAFLLLDRSPRHVVGSERPVIGSFSFVAKANGVYEVAIGAEAPGSRPVGVVEVRVGYLTDEEKAPPVTDVLRTALPVVAGLALVLFFVTRLSKLA